MKKYSLFSIIQQGVRKNKGWPRAFGTVNPDDEYEIIIVGGGGHGLATAYYLAKNHGITRVAVLEAGWIGAGNAARNMTIIRSNYTHPVSVRFYERSLRLWEGLAQELNFNVMFNQQGVLSLLHSFAEHASANQLVAQWTGSPPLEILTPDQIQARLPAINLTPCHRIYGALFQPSGGTVRHDAVIWAYARAASHLGVEIMEDTPVKEILVKGGQVYGVLTTKGVIQAPVVALATAGDSTALAATAGLELPIESRPLQCLVSEPLKPVFNEVIMSDKLGAYVNQTDKGDLVIGTSVDPYTSFKRQGSYLAIENALSGVVELFPFLSRVQMNRQWGGNVDVSPDTSPIISQTAVEGLYLNCGWGTGGFKSIPASGTLFAHSIAHGKMHPDVAPFGLQRFDTGALIDETASTGVAH